MERDWLKMITGILALGFGVYCLVLLMLIWMNSIKISSFLAIFSLIYAIIYLIYGASLLFIKKGRNFNFLAFVFAFGFSWGFGGLPWYIWPLFIMPIIILALTILMLVRLFMGRKVKVDKW